MQKISKTHALQCVFMMTLSACSVTQTSVAHHNESGMMPQKAQALSHVNIPSKNQSHYSNVDPILFLNRITWGANVSSAAQLNAIGVDNYLQQQLQAKTAILPPMIQVQIDSMTISQKPFVTMMHELAVQREQAAKMKGTDDTLRKAYQEELTRLAREAASRALLRHVYSNNQLLEQMDWFWMNHFNISNRKDNVRAMLGDFEEHAIRPNALGNFRDLLRDTLLHPAMLRYLDNEHNAVNKINENYARELMELHTMGVGSGYTQNDVQEVARVLTGLGINLRGDRGKKAWKNNAKNADSIVEFNPKRHDFGDKKILGQTIVGNGAAELDQILIILTRHPATANFISRKLAMYFVSDKPSDSLVSAMAKKFLQTDGDIPSVLKVMFDTPEFIASLGKKFRDPMHYVISSVRLIYDGSTIVNTGPMLNWLKTLGQQQNGHLTPDGYSLNEDAWSSSAQMVSRFDVAKIIARGVPALFKPETIDGDNEKQNFAAREEARLNLAQNEYVKTMMKNFSAASQEALTQSVSAQEWNAFFLATPEMMRR